MVDLKALHEALAEYLRGLLRRTLGGSAPFHDSVANLLSAKGLILSRNPETILPVGILTSYVLISGNDWRRALPAAAGVELAHMAVELFDKFLDNEGLSTVAPTMTGRMVNEASYLQALAHRAAAELAEQGFPAEKIAGVHQALTGLFIGVALGQELDTRERHDWPSYDDAIDVTARKSGPIGATIGTIGAYLATDRQDLIAACTEFGYLSAVRGQIINDLNDASPSGYLKTDVKERRRTLPLVYLARTEDPEFLPEARMLRGTALIQPDEEARIRKAVVNCGAIEYTAVVADVYYGRAVSALAPAAREFDTVALERALLGHR